jgi:O-antigen/teichoic acid export membrane protein
VLIPLFSIVFFAFLYAFEPSASGAALAYVGATATTLLLAWVFWRRASRTWKEAATTGRPPLRETLAGITSFASVAINQVVIANIDLIILGFFGTVAEVGIYGAARRLSSLLTFVLTSVNSVLAPKFASLYRRQDTRAMEQLGQFSTKLMVVLTLPPILFFLAAPGWIMQVFGEEFRQGATALVILSLGQLVNVCAGSVCALLLMTGHEREMRNFTTLSLLANVVLCLVLIPRLGIEGAAIASACSLATLNLLAFSAAVRQVRISTLPFYSVAGK